MNKRKFFILFFGSFLFLSGVLKPLQKRNENQRFISYQVDLKKQELKFFWKDNKNLPFGNFKTLKEWLNKNKQTLVFAMNGGMYKTDNSPQGLYIQEQKVIAPLDTTLGNGNFYIHPNGVFYTTTTNTAAICPTRSFVDNGKIKYATQSGPILLFDGKINPAFNPTSTNLNIRNGVGILPNNKIVFAMSQKEISFYDFAKYFKNLGCKNALYLDGFVSRTYLPEIKWEQFDGNFGVIIAVTKTIQ
jgi:uncharacterized protein YigE (DUF2233 family)